MDEASGWFGKYEIIIGEERFKINNRITNVALSAVRNAWYGDVVNLQIKYLALGTGSLAINDEDTALGIEQFRTEFIDKQKKEHNQLQTTAIVLDAEAVFRIKEIGVFTAGNVMISRILWDRDKTNLESVQFIRTDTINRG